MPALKRKPAKSSAKKPSKKSSQLTWKQIAALDKKIIAAKNAKRKALSKVFGQSIRPDIPFNTLSGAITLAELFGDKQDLIIIHNMGRSCVYCTMWADGLIGLASHLSDRASFALSSPDSPQTQHDFAKSRNWPFQLVSVPAAGFAYEMGFEVNPGEFAPGASAFHKDAKGKITRTGAAVFGPGDDFCALWPLFDLLKGGPGKWAPKYNYKTAESCGGCCNCS